MYWEGKEEWTVGSGVFQVVGACPKLTAGSSYQLECSPTSQNHEDSHEKQQRTPYCCTIVGAVCQWDAGEFVAAQLQDADSNPMAKVYLEVAGEWI